MPRPIHVRIDREALVNNCRVVKRHCPTARVWAVIKANAYGHGLLPVAETLADEAHGFAVLDFAEAIALRKAGIRQPILLLEGCFSVADWAEVAAYGLTAVVHQFEQLQWLYQAGLSVRVPVYVKLNTGMNRLGFRPEGLPALREMLARHPVVGEVTLMSHFADADADADAGAERGVANALHRFSEMAGDWRGPVSLANSAALLRYPQTVRDWVRPGIVLYGGSPFAAVSAESLGLRPVMCLSSEIIAIQTVMAGEAVGYGSLFVSDCRRQIGVVACGYADGYPRHAPTGTPVLVKGRRTRLIGRVSMDMLMVDLHGMTDVAVGDPVVLWGEGLPADEVAAAAGTVSYELFTALARRVPVRVV